MNYNDENVLSVEEYELIAKAYADALKEKGLKIIHINNELAPNIIEEIFNKLTEIKSLLFALGGFLNTSSFYSLNERHLKKLSIIFDKENIKFKPTKIRDKTRNFLSFLSCELSFIKLLLEIAEKTNYENELKLIANDRLTLLSQILSLWF